MTVGAVSSTNGITTNDDNITIDCSNAPGGTIAVNQAITTAGSSSGGAVSVTGGVTIANTVTAAGGNVTLSGSAGQQTQISSTVSSDDGEIAFHSPILLTGDTIIDADAGKITLNGTIDGNFNLTLNTTGVTDINQAIGGSTALASLTTNAGGTTEVGANITTPARLTLMRRHGR